MLAPLHVLIAAAALAVAPVATGQTQSREIQQVGIWHLVESQNECTALFKYGEVDLVVALIYPRPGTKTDAALMFTSGTLFGDAKEREPYPVRLVLAENDSFETRWSSLPATGMVFKNGDHGIRIAGPVDAFTDSLAKSEALRLEGIDRGTINLLVQDTRPMVDALRKCVAPR